jgi:hypothetical protein
MIRASRFKYLKNQDGESSRLNGQGFRQDIAMIINAAKYPLLQFDDGSGW